MTMIDFSHKSYLGLLRYIQGLGYRIGPFRDFSESDPYVILRHDIDFSITKAEEMAELDRHVGVQSTFFVLLTAPYYNPLWEENLQALRRIAAMGHEIGLHYDCSGFDALSADEQYHLIQTLAGCLESHLGMHVKSIAQHKPTAATTRPEFPGYLDAYSQRFFRDIAYISDSRMMFRVKDVHAFFRGHARCQAALHPVWWYAKPRTRMQVFEELKSQLAQQVNHLIDCEHSTILEFLAAYNQPSP